MQKLGFCHNQNLKERVGYSGFFEYFQFFDVKEQVYTGLTKFLREWDLRVCKWYLYKERHFYKIK